MSIKIGKITYDPKDVIGNGSNSVVYRGTFEKKEAAVKKVEKMFLKLIKSEIDILQQADENRNIIRYFCSEEDRDHYYIALELCFCTLKDYVSNNEYKKLISLKSVCEQIVSGMESLHNLKIVHRDIKPTNALLMKTKSGEIVVKVSDFGFAKQIDDSSSQMSVVLDESNYWKVPEMSQGRYNANSDVYSAGCLLYYLFNGGRISTNKDIVTFNWHSTSSEVCDGVLIKHLVTIMTKPNPDERPPFECIKFHPYFWDGQKTLNFLVKTADFIKENSTVAYTMKSLLQENAEEIIGSTWLSRLEPVIEQSLIYRRANHGYGGNSISELLRALRNKHAHYDEMTEAAKQTYGSLPDGFASYWTTKFPALLLHIYLKGYRSGLHHDENFNQYYPNSQKCDKARK